jgi:hypothetical protein
MAMEKLEGIPRDVALKKIWLRDSKGLIVKDRPAGGISHHKADFAHEHRCRDKVFYIVKTTSVNITRDFVIKCGLCYQPHFPRTVIFDDKRRHY